MLVGSIDITRQLHLIVLGRFSLLREVLVELVLEYFGVRGSGHLLKEVVPPVLCTHHCDAVGEHSHLDIA